MGYFFFFSSFIRLVPWNAPHATQEDFMNQRLISLLAALVFIALAGCGSSSSSSLGSGDLNVWLTDTASPEYKAVYISVNQVEVKASSDDNDNGWQMVDVVNKTINLLDLTGGILESLGSRNLPAQPYNQLRLILASAPDDEKNLNGNDHPFANYVIIETDDTVHELNVPSEYQSGIILVKEFTITVSGLTELILDFDAMRSVVMGGDSGQWFLNPVIEVLDTVTLAEIGGSVTDSPTPGTVQQDTHVSAQIYNAIALDEKDRVTIQAGTLTIADGSYLLRVPEGEYRVVAVKDGFRPQCRIVTATPGETLTADFALTSSASGTLTVKITGLAQTDDAITLSIRRTSLCTDGSTLARPYEVTSRSFTQKFFADGGEAVFTLPARNSSAGYTGDYTVMAYGDSVTTRYQTETVTSTPTTITFRY